MIEVFSTNIYCREQANLLIEEIHKTFEGYRANMDLADCGYILRIVYSNAHFEVLHFKNWLKQKAAWQKLYRIYEV